MFFPEGAVRVCVYGQPTDMRKSFDGLYALLVDTCRLICRVSSKPGLSDGRLRNAIHHSEF